MQTRTRSTARFERLVNLALALKAATTPLTLAQLVQRVPGYPVDKDPETLRAAFERDKKELRRNGIAIVAALSCDEKTVGYVIDSTPRATPFVLDPADCTTLLNALHVRNPSAQPTRDATVKLVAATARGAHLDPPSQSSKEQAKLLALALTERRSAHFRYVNRAYEVEPYGMAHGTHGLVLVARDPRRMSDRVQTYRLDRVTSDVKLGERNGFELPHPFDPAFGVKGPRPTLSTLAPAGEGHREKDGTGTRVRRLFALLGYLSCVGDVALESLADVFHLSPRALRDELEVAACCGLAPFTPDRLLEVFDDDGMVRGFALDTFVPQADLTRDEALACLDAGRLVLSLSDDGTRGALSRVLAKLERYVEDDLEKMTTSAPAWPVDWTMLLKLRVRELNDEVRPYVVGTPRERADRSYDVVTYLADRRWQGELLRRFDRTFANEPTTCTPDRRAA